LIVSRGRLVESYRKESNAKVKERLLLVIKVVGDGELPAHVVKGIHRSKPWASYVNTASKEEKEEFKKEHK
jgi:hypothetical protein